MEFQMPNEIGAAFAAAFPDGPPQEPAEPNKAAIRSVGSTIDTQLSNLSVRIVGAAEGYEIQPTIALLASKTGTDGKPGRVTNNNGSTHLGLYIDASGNVATGTVKDWGEYVWLSSVTAWVRTGDVIDASAITTLETAGVPRVASFYKYLELAGPLAYDSGKLLVPNFRFRKADGSVVTAAPASGHYFELDTGYADASYYPSYIAYYDVAAGTVAQDYSYAGSNVEGVGGADKPLIALTWGGGVQSPYAVARSVPNEFSFNREGYAPLIDSGTYRIGIVDATLTGLLIEKGYKAADGHPSFGGFIDPVLMRGVRHLFVRVYMQSDVDNDFPEITLFQNTFGGSVSRGAMRLEKQYSARLASFLQLVNVGDINNDILGVQVKVTGGSGRDITLSGLQYAFASDPLIYINRMDHPYPGASEGDRLRAAYGYKDGPIIYGPKLCLIEGQPLELFPAALTGSRDLTGPLTSLTTGYGTPASVGLMGRDCITIDPARFADGQSGNIVVNQPFPNEGRAQVVDITIGKTLASQLAGQTMTGLFLGDSLTEAVVTYDAVRKALQAAGATLNLVGTMFADPNKREGRSGSSLEDHTAKDVSYMTPVSSPSAYTAMTDLQKRTANPFVFAGSGAGSYGGWKFDFGTYLSTYGITVPQFVVLNLGTNDLDTYSTDAALVAAVKEALGVIVPSIRAAGGGNIKVLVVVHGSGWLRSESDRHDSKRMRSLALATLSYVRSLGDANVRFVPAFAHQNWAYWNLFTTISTDADTGTRLATLSDAVHFDGPIVSQYGQCVAAHIADMLT